MRAILLTVGAALLLSVSDGAVAEPAADPATTEAAAPFVVTNAVGRWLHDPQGNTIGSVRGLADGGRTAVIMVGSYFRPGSHEARVSAGAPSVVDGKITLQAETGQALAARSHPQG